jgi:hypothetical protein
VDGLDEAKSLILQMAELKNRLRDLGVIRSEGEITVGYAEWFCSKKFDLELCSGGEVGYDALSKHGERVVIRSRVGSDIDFTVTFDGIGLGEFDYLLVVFVDERSWMIDAVYRVSMDVVEEFLGADPARRFMWKRESRSLSLQVYPDDENMLPMI